MSDEKTANMVLRSVYLPQDLDANLRDLAFNSEKSKNELIRELVQEALVVRGYTNKGQLNNGPTSRVAKQGKTIASPASAKI